MSASAELLVEVMLVS